MNADQLIKKLSEKIGELEVNNMILMIQIEEMAKQLEELKNKDNECQ